MNKDQTTFTTVSMALLLVSIPAIAGLVACSKKQDFARTATPQEQNEQELSGPHPGTYTAEIQPPGLYKCGKDDTQITFNSTEVEVTVVITADQPPLISLTNKQTHEKTIVSREILSSCELVSGYNTGPVNKQDAPPPKSTEL